MTLGAGVNSLVKTCLGDSREAPKSKPIGLLMPVSIFTAYGSALLRFASTKPKQGAPSFAAGAS
jgi:hypothetical protein